MKKPTAVIIGAGPAGLTAAYELLIRTNYKPIIIEKDSQVGGISKTILWKGNRMDFGGHRFFSKSDRVMQWWEDLMPIDDGDKKQELITYRGQTRVVSTSANPRAMFLVRPRYTRIYFLKKFFSYPIALSLDTLKKLGFIRSLKIAFSYLYIHIFPRKENNLEDFMVNRFGLELYATFFEKYTEKVWGKHPKNINKDWGAQRIKGLSLRKAILHALTKPNHSDKQGIRQKNTETSLIEKFLYPKLGPGQLWELVAEKIESLGGKIILNTDITGLEYNNKRIQSVSYNKGKAIKLQGDIVFSTMPIKELVAKISGTVPHVVKTISSQLEYRDFISVGVLLKKLHVKEGNKYQSRLKDTWIYIQEPNVKLGRIQIFNNWSSALVKNPENIWIGLEYFVTEGDELWMKSKKEMSEYAIKELIDIGFIRKDDVIDTHVEKMLKTYPSYFGAYNSINTVRNWFDTSVKNIYLIGRNGMHKYNNSDHSILTALEAVDNIESGNLRKRSNIWSVNTEQSYNEEKDKTSPV